MEGFLVNGPHCAGRRARVCLGLALPVLALTAATASADDAGCIRDLRASAVSAGVSGADFDRVTRGLTLDTSILKFYNTQPEASLAPVDYLHTLVDDQRIANGKKALADYRTLLAQIDKSFGVPPQVVVAIWGIESDYGGAIGKRPVLQSLASLICAGARASYFQGEFVAAVKILASGKARPGDMVGSWAGAFGHMQFMPSNFIEDGVDVDGDGVIDLVHSMPDSFGSAANELVHGGWVAGIPWGYEVTVPPGFDSSVANRKDQRSFAQWANAGVKRVDGQPLPASGSAGMILPAGLRGPIFLTTRNFDAIYAYNMSESYALTVAYLSDRIAGGGTFRTPWPSPSTVLSRAEVIELQGGLNRKGFDAGVADGVAGPLTRAAIGAFEKQLGRPTTGEPTRAILEAIRATD